MLFLPGMVLIYYIVYSIIDIFLLDKELVYSKWKLLRKLCKNDKENASIYPIYRFQEQPFLEAHHFPKKEKTLRYSIDFPIDEKEEKEKYLSQYKKDHSFIFLILRAIYIVSVFCFLRFFLRDAICFWEVTEEKIGIVKDGISAIVLMTVMLLGIKIRCIEYRDRFDMMGFISFPLKFAIQCKENKRLSSVNKDLDKLNALIEEDLSRHTDNASRNSQPKDITFWYRTSQPFETLPDWQEKRGV